MSFDSSIFYAAAAGRVEELVHAASQRPDLIDAGHPNSKEQTPMFVAAENGHVAVIEALHRLGSTALDRPENTGTTPMFAAAVRGHACVVETLHRLGSTALDCPNDNGWWPMHAAALNGHAPVVETLHRLGSTAIDQPNRSGWTPAHAAVAFGRLSVIRKLHRLGCTTLDRSGADLMGLAFERNRPVMAELLLATGVDVAALADRWPDEVQALLETTSEEQSLELRWMLYFSPTLLDMLLVRDLR